MPRRVEGAQSHVLTLSQPRQQAMPPPDDMPLTKEMGAALPGVGMDVEVATRECLNPEEESYYMVL